MQKLRFGIIGCGKIAERHAGIISILEEAELTAVCDIAGEKAKELGEKYQAHWYASAREMLEKEELDIVNILTPSGNHAETLLDIADKVANIIVEKPMALKLEDIDRMMDACLKFKTNLFVVKQNRFNVPVKKLREAIEEGRFGKLVLGTARVRWMRTQEYYDHDKWRGTWAMDGGVFANQASHHLDLLTWMMGDVESVMAMTARRLVDIETEDTGIAVLRFKNGALGAIEATTASRPKSLEGSISILGEKGSVEIGGYSACEMKSWNFIDCREGDSLVLGQWGRNPQHAHGFAHYEYIKNVIERVKEGKHHFTDGFVSRKSLEVIRAIHESAMAKREITLSFKFDEAKLNAR
ncbi:MAG: Gfo/Idh/MocA family oxidoreductase [Candidatus Omnitrophica bacterium]|nr:Gfo/Idh/MocA family oxidoreductase [Candidatus Omnitrophota bacterium]